MTTDPPRGGRGCGPTPSDANAVPRSALWGTVVAVLQRYATPMITQELIAYSRKPTIWRPSCRETTYNDHMKSAADVRLPE